MKRIRNAALLAAALAVSSFSHAQEPHGAQQRGLAEDILSSHGHPTHRLTDPADQAALKEVDHAHEGRLNDRSRHELRQKGRENKQRVRELP